ncbi:MAG: hypothetical protein GXO88_09515 [Chlorobi bacterium]|nr:hypothetical protein [Chlorobiota bacterium]
MPFSTNITIRGKIAEIIDEEARKNVRIVCDNQNVLVKLDHIDEIGLGDSISIKGIIDFRSLEINGIEIKTHKY